jgi:hypothetical protein
MPSIIIKVDPEEDLYACYSTITEGFTAWGPERELTEILQEWQVPCSIDRFERADETGTSARYGDGRWEDEGFLVRWNPLEDKEMDQAYWLPREVLKQWLETGRMDLVQELEE